MKELIIELTNRCQNNCIHCSSKNCLANDKIYDISMKEIEPVVSSALKAGYNRIVLSGGEPVLHPAFCSIVDEFSEKKIELKMYTSGVADDYVYVSSKYAEAISKIKTVVLSCYSIKGSKHNKITNNKKSFTCFKKFIDVFSSVIDEIEINFVPMAGNVEEINAVYEQHKDILSRFNVLKLVNQGNASLNWGAICVDQTILHEQLALLKNKTKTKIGNSFGSLSNSPYQCEAGRTKICITFDGYVIPCEVFKATRKKFRHCSDYRADIDLFAFDLHQYSSHDYSRGCQARTISL